jgi:hypothetical protein
MQLKAMQPRALKHKVLDSLDLERGEYVMVIDVNTQKGRLYKLDYVLVDETDVSTGKNPGDKQRSGDHRSPRGIYHVVSVQDSSTWKHNSNLAYGPYFARLSTGSWDSKGRHNPNGRSPIGMHGTHEPEKLGTPASHGCIRLDNQVIQEYVDMGYVKKGTRVAIVNDYTHVPISVPMHVPQMNKPILAKAETVKPVIQVKPVVQEKLAYTPVDKPEHTFDLDAWLAGVQKQKGKEADKHGRK